MSDTLPSNADTGSGGGSGLNKKVGGVPLKYIIAIGIVVGFGYFLYTRMRGGGTTTASTLPTFTTATGQQGTSTGDTTLTSGGSGATGTTTPTYTNAQWGLNAANALSGQGQWSPSDIATALNNYLNGIPNTATQTAIVNAAIQAYGNPPNGVIGAVQAQNASAPTTAGTGQPVTLNDIMDLYQKYLGRQPDAGGLNYWLGSGMTYEQVAAKFVASPEYQADLAAGRGISSHTYTTLPGDTLVTIAEKFYNNSDWSRIYNVNVGAIGSNPNGPLPAGITLQIPN